MVLSDFLSRKKQDDSNPHEIIPISFNMHQVLHEKYYNLEDAENYLVQTRSQTKSSGNKLPEVHGIGKNLDPTILPEKQHANPIKGIIEKPCIVQGKSRIEKEKISSNQSNHYSSIRTVTENSWRDKNKNKKNKSYKFHRSNGFHKNVMKG